MLAVDEYNRPHCSSSPTTLLQALLWCSIMDRVMHPGQHRMLYVVALLAGAVLGYATHVTLCDIL